MASFLLIFEVNPTKRKAVVNSDGDHLIGGQSPTNLKFWGHICVGRFPRPVVTGGADCG